MISSKDQKLCQILLIFSNLIPGSHSLPNTFNLPRINMYTKLIISNLIAGSTEQFETRPLGSQHSSLRRRTSQFGAKSSFFGFLLKTPSLYNLTRIWSKITLFQSFAQKTQSIQSDPGSQERSMLKGSSQVLSNDIDIDIDLDIEQTF